MNHKYDLIGIHEVDDLKISSRRGLSPDKPLGILDPARIRARSVTHDVFGLLPSDIVLLNFLQVPIDPSELILIHINIYSIGAGGKQL